MSEEIRNNGMEINEAALENVSGGAGHDNPNSVAARLCVSCQEGINRGLYRCTGGVTELGYYLMEHGMDSVMNCILCPFRKRV